MAEPSSPDLEDRFRQLEFQIRELRMRILALEKLLAPRAENPTDRTTVREKATYDWQS
jgi:hypothetical protein